MLNTHSIRFIRSLLLVSCLSLSVCPALRAQNQSISEIESQLKDLNGLDKLRARHGVDP
jgi:hypothetical protein